MRPPPNGINTLSPAVNTPSGVKIPNVSLNNISSNLTQAAQLLTNYIVSPLQRLGIGGFQFDKVVHSDLDLQAEYTENFVEQGSYVTDHVIFKPKKITMTGYVGEKTYDSGGPQSDISQLVQKLTPIPSLLQTLTVGMQQLKNTLDVAKATEIQNTINSSVDFWNTLKLLNPPRTKVGQAYNYFVALFNSSTILSLTEPDGTYHINMVIESIHKKTREETLDIVDFVVSLKEWRTADTLYEKFDINNYAGRAGQAQDETTNQGKVQGITTNKTPQSILFSLNALRS